MLWFLLQRTGAMSAVTTRTWGLGTLRRKRNILALCSDRGNDLQPGGHASSLLESSPRGATATPACDPPPLPAFPPTAVITTPPIDIPSPRLVPCVTPFFACSLAAAILSPQSHRTWEARDFRAARQWLHCDTGRPFFAIGSSLRSVSCDNPSR
jgi:hypothetical protein